MSLSWTAALRAGLSLDLRSLALLRAGLAGALLIDALSRLCSAGLLYADSGLLPRAVAAQWLEPTRLSLHMANGSTLFALALCLLQAGAAFALLIGWRSRVASLLCWLLAVSAAARNPLAISAGEALAISLLFWGLFLPWSARWSVDEALHHTQANGAAQWSSVAGAALFLQVLLLPVFSALEMLAWPASGGLLQALLTLPDTLSLPGRWLLQMTEVRAAIEFALIGLPFLILILVLLGLRYASLRRLALALYLLLALFGLISGSASLLPWLVLIGAGLLIDSALWARLADLGIQGEQRLYHREHDQNEAQVARLLQRFLCLTRTQVLPDPHSARAARLLQGSTRLVLIDPQDRAHLDADAVRELLRQSPLLLPLRPLLNLKLIAGLYALKLRMLCRLAPMLAANPASTAPLLPTHYRSTSALALLTGTVLLSLQLATLGWLPRDVQNLSAAVLRPLALDQAELRSLPMPPLQDRWIVVPGERRDGRQIDVLAADGRPPQFDRNRFPLLPGARGRQYEQALTDADAGPARAALAAYLCREQAPELARLRVVQVLRPRSEGAAPDEQQVLLRHECAGAER